MNIKSLLKIIFAVYLSWFLFSVEVFSQELNFKMHELMVIGDDEYAPDEYLFVAPQQISTDSQNNIYVRDVVSTRGFMSKEILKFSQEGKYLATIGRAGQGPGEFSRILCFCVNSEDELVIYDEINRRITRYNSANNEFIVAKQPADFYFLPKYLFPFTKTSYLIVNSIKEKLNKKLFHIFSKDFSERLEMFGESEQIWNMSEPFMKRRSKWGALNICMVDSTKIAAVSQYYEGEICLLEKNNNTWVTKNVIGKKPEYRSFKEIPRSKIKSKKYRNKRIISYGDQGKVLSFMIQNQSIGIFKFKDKFIIHFILLSTKNHEVILGIDLFNIHGKYIGFQNLKIYKKNPIYRTKILWKDEKNCFFMTEEIDGIPVIKKFELVR